MNGAPEVKAEPQGPGEARFGYRECGINRCCDSDMARNPLHTPIKLRETWETLNW